MSIKLSDYLWQFIVKQNIRHVFMFPGGGAMHLVDSLGRNSDIENITMLHEQACTFAAETYGRMNYHMGVVLVTTGPGATNALTGAAAAWMESSPILIISGQVKTTDLKSNFGVRQRGTQEVGIIDMARSVTKYAETIMDPAMIRYHLERAFHIAKEGRPGPVWLDIPLDIQGAMIDAVNLKGFDPPEHDGLVRNTLICSVEKIIDLLKKSKQPVLIAGQGIERSPDGLTTFRALVDILKIPILTSWMATELLEHNNPYNLGKPGMVAPRYSNYSMQESDLIIAVGTRLDPVMIGYDPDDFAPNAKKVIVDIDESELGKFSFPIEQKVKSDATEFLKETLKSLKQGYDPGRYEPWLLKCQEIKTRYPLVLDEFRNDNEFVNPYYFFDRLSDFMDDNEVIIPGSSGAAIDVFWMCFKNREKQRLFSTGALGSMGYGIPAAIGASLATRSRVVCIEGDGSLQLNIQELATIKGLNLPIKIFIMDNGGYLSIMNMQRAHFKANFVGANKSSGLNIPDYTTIAKAYGFLTYIIENHSHMDNITKEVLATDGPVLCKVCMRNDLQIQPKVMSRAMPDGSMSSGSLSELWPFLS